MNLRFLLILFALCCTQLYSQDIKPVIQAGHENKIEFYAACNQKQLLMTADGNEVMLWNTQSGKQLRRIASPVTIRGAALCSNGEEVAVASYDYGKDAALRIYNARNGDPLFTVSFAEKNSWGGVSYKALEELVYDKVHNRVAIRSHSDITIVDLKERKKLYSFSLSSYDNKFAFTSDPSIFCNAFKDNEGLKVALIDTNGAVKQQLLIAQERQQATLIADNLQKKFFLLDNKATVHVFNESLQLVDSVKTDSVNSVWTIAPPKMSLSADGKKLLVPLHKNQYLYDLDKKQWLQKGWKWINTSTGLLFCTNDATRAVKISEQIPEIIDAETGNDIYTLSNKGKATPHIRFTPSGEMLSGFNSSSWGKSSTILNLRTGIPLNDIDLDYAIFQWITDSVVLCSPSSYKYSYDSELRHSLEIKNLYTGKIIRQITIPKLDKNIEYAIISKDQAKIALLTLEQMILLSGNNFDKRTVYNFSKGEIARTVLFSSDSKKLIMPLRVVNIFDIPSLKWTALKDTAALSLTGVTITPDGKELWYEDYRSLPAEKNNSLALSKQVIMAYNFETGKTVVKKTYDTLIASIACHPSEDIYAIGFFNGTVQLRTISTDALLYQGKDHHSHVDELHFAPAKNWLVSLGEDGLLQFRNYKTFEHVISSALLYLNNEYGYVLLTPENYYLVSPSLANVLHYSKDFSIYSFAQLDLQLNRPDKVLERIGIADEELLNIHRKAFRRRLAKAGFASEVVPDFSSLQPLKITNTIIAGNVTTEPVFNLGLETEQSVASMKELNVYVNGQRVQTRKINSPTLQVPVTLTDGINNIEAAYITTSGIENLRERIEVVYQPLNPSPSKTYYIGIAVSHYKDSTMNLKYAVKDVEDIATRFKQKDKTVDTFLFTDEKATKNNLDAIRKVLSNTNVNDRVVISFSGHGLLDTAFNFYFGGWDMDFTQPSVAGISYNNITALLDNIPARRKLLLIDACHSGEVDKDIVSFTNASSDTQFVNNYNRSTIKIKKKGKLQNTVKLMEQYFTDINRDNGANIISAAAGEEYALESSEWNNGVFSYSFITGLFDKKADSNRDGKVTQSEIRKYMQQQVLQLTRGRQQPTSRSINSEFDWEF